MVRQVNLNPLIEYLSWGPLLGLGCPLTIFAGNTKEATQMYE
jgi:hypothetical protein